MATNQTQHYGLNQWELSDSVVMADFNADNQKVDEALHSIRSSIPHVCSGSYVGTGTSGADNPNTLIFNFPIQFLAVTTNEEYVRPPILDDIGPWFFIRPWTSSNRVYNSNVTANAYLTHVKWLENGVSWYAQCINGEPMDPDRQLNKEGITYHYIAIG